MPLQLARADLVVATSERVRRELELLAPTCAPRLIVKPNAVDGRCFPPFVRPEAPPGTPFRLLSVARIDPKKGLHDLLAAAAEGVRLVRVRDEDGLAPMVALLDAQSAVNGARADGTRGRR